jgi:twitching motility protein PilT
VLEAIISQQLLPKKAGGRVLAVEVMIPNSAIRNLIREDKIHQIYAMMQTGQTKFGMLTMNQSLFELYNNGTITYDDALSKSPVPDELITMIQRSAAAEKRR